MPTTQTANPTSSPSSLPVAIFLGGTAGIGRAIAQAFASHTNGNAHIIIVGRNKAAADEIIASFPKPPGPYNISATSTQESHAKHEFVACDATLMKNVDATIAELRARLPKLNYLVMTSGFLTLKGRDETEEGLDRRTALVYYARWKFARDLAPLLQRARDAGEDAKVLTVLAAGTGQPIDEDDFGMKKNYGVMKQMLAVPTYNDAMIMSFAERYPDISFVHVHPGVVRTQILQKSHWALRALNPFVQVAVYPFSVSERESGEALFNGLLRTGTGYSRLNGKGDSIGDKGLYCESAETRRRLWEHTEETIDAVLSTGTGTASSQR